MSRSARALRRRRARERQEFRDFAQSLLGADASKIGISFDQAAEMITAGARKMLQRMGEDGMTEPSPRGGVCPNARSLVKTLQTGLLMLDQGERGVDVRGDAPDLSEEESGRYLFGLVAGAVTMGAAALLYLTRGLIYMTTYALRRRLFCAFRRLFFAFALLGVGW